MSDVVPLSRIPFVSHEGEVEGAGLVDLGAGAPVALEGVGAPRAVDLACGTRPTRPRRNYGQRPENSRLESAERKMLKYKMVFARYVGQIWMDFQFIYMI